MMARTRTVRQRMQREMADKHRRARKKVASPEETSEAPSTTKTKRMW